MSNTICDLLTAEERAAFATSGGRDMHLRLQRLSLSASRAADAELVAHILECDGLARFFSDTSRTELPVAGIINGRMVSRRIDRIIVDDTARTIDILDYKTDTDRTIRRDKYVAQVGEYVALMRRIYPEYTVGGYILWLHDWTLERVV